MEGKFGLCTGCSAPTGTPHGGFRVPEALLVLHLTSKVRQPFIACAAEDSSTQSAADAAPCKSSRTANLCKSNAGQSFQSIEVCAFCMWSVLSGCPAAIYGQAGACDGCGVIAAEMPYQSCYLFYAHKALCGLVSQQHIIYHGLLRSDKDFLN